jgi:hypothetical protein
MIGIRQGDAEDLAEVLVPRQVGVDRVDRDADQLHAALLELLVAAAELGELRGADRA